LLEHQLLEEFGAALREQASERLLELPDDQVLAPEASLLEAMLAYLEEAGSVPGHDLCAHQDEGGHRPCKVVAYSLPEDSVRLELFTSSGPIGSTSLPRSEVGRLAGWAARFFEYAAKGDHARFASNPLALEAAILIKAELDRIEEVRVHVLTDAQVRDRSVDNITILGRDVVTEVWDLERLYRVSGEDVTRDKIDIDLNALMGRPLACLEMKPRPAEYETYLVILPGKLVFDLFDQYGAQLFEFNVRSFLQAKGTVNRGLQRTLKEEPGRFLAYNNGLTATADQIEVSTWHGETVIHRIRGLQIVNGAQTTASIHRAMKVDKLPLDAVAVSMKLTLVPSDKLEEFVPLIARFANTQNPIQVADLSASDRFHQEFETLSESVWPPGEESRWFYERARGSYQMARSRLGTTPARRRDFDRTHPKTQHFGKTDLAKYLMTWWGHPQIVSRGSQKNYASFMFGLRERMGNEWSPDKEFFRKAIAVALLFKSAQAVVRRAKLESYGANVVTYMVSLLSKQYESALDFEELWQAQEVSPEMQALFAGWAPIIHAELVASAANRNVTEWCKKDDCWTEIAALQLSISGAPPPEFTLKENHEETRHDAHIVGGDLVADCTSLNATEWAKVLAWAMASGAIDDYDLKVAHTLSGYAMNGWIKPPSERQAIRGVRVLEAARKVGVLE